ncbi:MAG: N-acetyltransferase [Sulfurovaceae bacterium]|nr:N-acetyltransferase [Sulfurovaceae bacterium]MDD5549143.1 N-acetyltransferase [Sulfurovaceae bacterium]
MIKLSKAKISDIADMQTLVADEVEKGVILYRSEDEIATNIRSYILAKDENKLVGYMALHIHSKKLAEVRSLVVNVDYRDKGIGADMVRFAILEAKELGIEENILSLTYVPDFFIKLGFKEINKESIPDHKIWADCIKCIHFPVCNEVALVYSMKE